MKRRESNGQQQDKPPRRRRAPTNSSERGFGAAQGKESAADDAEFPLPAQRLGSSPKGELFNFAIFDFWCSI